MIHSLQKRWVFTWNADKDGNLPSPESVQGKLNNIASEAVFQLEVGETTNRRHYQGRLKLLSRKSKKALLKIFGEIFSTENLTLQVELAYDSSSYCEKLDTRIGGPWYAGLAGYLSEKEEMKLELKKWQSQLLGLITGRYQNYFRNRKVVWIQDIIGGQGKSTFIRYLAANEKSLGMGIEKLPIDRPDRVRSAVIKLSKRKNVDIYMFDFTRTRGDDTRFNDLFEVIEELKNSFIVDIMYGNFNRAFLKPSIVLIFTNEDISKFCDYLSLDRWEAFTICQSSNELAYIDLYDHHFRVPFEEYLKTKLKNCSNG